MSNGSKTELPDWIWNLLDAISAYEDEHPILYRLTDPGTHERATCFGDYLTNRKAWPPHEVSEAADLRRRTHNHIATCPTCAKTKAGVIPTPLQPATPTSTGARRTSWRWNRDDFGWHYGWVGKDWWLSICGMRGEMACLDIGKIRIRWAAPNHRPLFSERYGHTKWHKVGRLGINVKRNRKALA